MTCSKKLLIIGGTYDPIHMGHFNTYLAAKNAIKPDLTLIIPNKIPPLKTQGTFCSNQDRIAMIKLTYQKEENVEIDLFEMNQKGNEPSYTYKTIEYLKKKYPDYQLYLLIGTDRYKDFHLWKNNEYIKQNVKIVNGYRKQEECINDETIICLELNPIDISSSQLRSIPDPKFLHPDVVKYIAENGLYLQNQIVNQMTDYRYQHTLRVTKTGLEIANQFHNSSLSKKVEIACMLHDVGKEFGYAKIISWFPEYDKNHFPTLHTLHGLASAKYAKEFLNVKDQEILYAIENHVIPWDDISLVGKIVYLADKLEPARTRKDISHRKNKLMLAKKNVEQAYNVVLKENRGKF